MFCNQFLIKELKDTILILTINYLVFTKFKLLKLNIVYGLKKLIISAQNFQFINIFYKLLKYFFNLHLGFLYSFGNDTFAKQ